jgi:hypothetical protein
MKPTKILKKQGNEIDQTVTKKQGNGIRQKMVLVRIRLEVQSLVGTSVALALLFCI